MSGDGTTIADRVAATAGRGRSRAALAAYWGLRAIGVPLVRLYFRFEVVRLWQWPVGELLQGGAGVLPLVPLGAMPEGLSPEEALPTVIQRIEERLVSEAAPAAAAKLMIATRVYCGRP